jgi:hypothetical protein
VDEQEIQAHAIRRMSEIAESVGQRKGEVIELHWGANPGSTTHSDLERSCLRLVITFREVWNDDLSFYASELEDYVTGHPTTMHRIDDALRIHLEALTRENRKGF